MLSFVWFFLLNQSKNNAVLEPRTGHFRGLVGFEAKAKKRKSPRQRISWRTPPLVLTHKWYGDKSVEIPLRKKVFIRFCRNLRSQVSVSYEKVYVFSDLCSSRFSPQKANQSYRMGVHKIIKPFTHQAVSTLSEEGHKENCPMASQ